MSNYFKPCLLPWGSLHSKPNGDVYTCCVGSDWSEKAVLGNLYSDSFESIVNSELLREIRLHMLSSTPHEYCKGCLSQEASGAKNTFKQNISTAINGDTISKCMNSTDNNGFVDPSLFKLVRWDLRFSNICNFGCRSCNPQNSSLISLEQNKPKSQIHSITTVSPHYGKLVELMDTHLPFCKSFSFTGGEPLVSPEHYMLLENLLKYDDNREISYNTNASTLFYNGKHIFDAWSKIKNLNVICSIDDIGIRAEYIRYGTKWNAVCSNLKDINQFLGKIKISCVVSMLNILYLDEFVDFINANFENPTIMLMYCYGPDHLNPAILPKSIKDNIVKKLQHINVYGKENIINALTKADLGYDTQTKLKHRKNFIDRMSVLDSKRNQSLQMYLPELYNVVIDERFLIDGDY
jgi:radical SAM protein with 4Fe4S-binding SPASM domain